jgi:hypothetical protein
MTDPSGKKPWTKPEVRHLGSARSLRKAIDTGSAQDLSPQMREALDQLLRDQG